MELYTVKSKSGKDIRDLVYLNKPIILAFKNDDSYYNFIDYVTNIISYFGFFTIQDILCYYSKPHDFITSKEYGWGVEDLDRTSTAVTNLNEEVVYELPIPKPINEIFIPKYVG